MKTDYALYIDCINNIIATSRDFWGKFEAPYPVAPKSYSNPVCKRDYTNGPTLTTRRRKHYKPRGHF